ncbi:unnamed protein product [Notodromas monacha]|uniref:Uncharacterized protein n=1 Tax=Notodromas monacha TaxID=399045 RepID=A0A7R9BLR8_9CRUS|nr:unnamed protein product [Notodromas monacha]CAG0917551.1 unnamed protein product [Notodromas monacha]
MGSTKELLTWSGQMPGLPNLPHFAMGFGNGSIVDKIPADMLFLVDRHWNQFPPLDTLTYMILGVFIIVAGMISVIGNFFYRVKLID